MYGILCLSHLSEMLFRARIANTTLRLSACMVLIALRACSLSEALRHLSSVIVNLVCKRNSVIQAKPRLAEFL